MRQNKTEKKQKRGLLRRGCRASFTVESAFLYPIIVILIAFILYLSMSWYVTVRTTAEDTEELRELDTRAYFLENIGELIEK